MNYKLTSKRGQCIFEVYDNKQKAMKHCGKRGTVQTSKGFICRDHLLNALSSDSKKELLDENNKCVENVNGFLKMVDGEEVIENQLDLF